jgi:hypothetical protein
MKKIAFRHRVPSPMNAHLEWQGRKLMCNGRCIAEVVKSRYGLHWFAYSGALVIWSIQRASEQSARRAVNRRFGLKD